MSLLKRAALAATAACLLASSALAAPAAVQCVKGLDETALQVRVVQTDLMVAALSCSATARYNDFVKGNQPALMAAHTQLGKFFGQKRGGESALNAFITKLANDSSKRSIANIAQFCQQTGWLYDAILNPARGDLNAFVGRLWVAQRHGFTPCTTPATYVVMGPSGATEVAANAAAQPVTATASAAPTAAGTPAKATVPAPAPGAVPTPQPKPARLASR